MKEAGVNEKTTIYSPFMNKGYMYRVAQMFYKTPEFATFKDQHLYNTCLRATQDSTGTLYLNKGYDNRNFTYFLNPVLASPNSFYFPPVFSPSVGGRAFVSLSDSKSYILWTLCFDDGLGTFVVDSLEKTLSAETLSVVKAHVKALGYKEEYFLEQNYDLDCDTPLTDVPVPKNYTVPVLLSNVVLVPRFVGVHSNVLLIKK